MYDIWLFHENTYSWWGHRLRQLLVWQMVSDVSEEPSTFIVRPDDRVGQSTHKTFYTIAQNLTNSSHPSNVVSMRQSVTGGRGVSCEDEWVQGWLHSWMEWFTFCKTQKIKTSVFSLSSFNVLREHLDVDIVLTPILHTAEVISTLS
jgi:hypothetical protein